MTHEQTLRRAAIEQVEVLKRIASALEILVGLHSTPEEPPVREMYDGEE